jgi:hypothetical protein
MTDWSLFLIPLVIAFDCLTIWDLTKRKRYSSGVKILWIVIIILFPIIGAAVYYFQLSLSYKSIQRKCNKKEKH